MKKFTVNSVVTHFSNGVAKSTRNVTCPYIYSVKDSILYVKETDINNTVMSINAVHSKKQIGKELQYLRTLVDMSGIEELKPRHKKVLEYLGIEDLEALMRQDERLGGNYIYLAISIFTTKYGRVEKAILSSISFRFMSKNVNSTDAIPITDWFVIKPSATETINDCSVDNITNCEVIEDSAQESNREQPWSMNFTMSEKPLDMYRFYSDIASCLEVLRCRAIFYTSNDFDPSIKDAAMLFGILENMKNIIYRRNIVECCGIDAPNTPLIELEVRRVYKMVLKFSEKIEELKTVEKDFFVLLGEAILALNLRNLCRRLTFRENTSLMGYM